MNLAGISANEIEAIARITGHTSDFPTFQKHVAMLDPKTHGVLHSLSPMILNVLFQIAYTATDRRTEQMVKEHWL